MLILERKIEVKDRDGFELTIKVVSLMGRVFEVSHWDAKGVLEEFKISQSFNDEE